MRPILVLIIFAIAVSSAQAEDGLFDISWREISKGVFVGGREDPLRYPVIANTTIVIGKKGVLVFDGGGFATQGEQTLAKIRAETTKPVTHLVISHWHGDHHRGTGPIIDAFPDAAIIAHRFTCAAMADGPERRVEEGEAQLDSTYEAVAGAVDRGEWFDGSPLTEAEKAYFRRMIADYPEYKTQLRLMRVTAPTEVFDDALEVDLGKRKVKLLHLGKGNTAGDIALWLEKDKFLATGDIVVAPVPYGFGSYPRDWKSVIDRLIAMQAKTIAPGHGPVMNGDDYLVKLSRLLDEAARQGEAKKDTTAAPTFAFDSETEIVGADLVKARLFQMFFTQPIVGAALNEARGVSEKNEPLDGDVAELCGATNGAG